MDDQTGQRRGRTSATVGVFALAAVSLAGCPMPSSEEAPPEDVDIAEGIFGRMGEPMQLADEQQRHVFERGERLARRRFDPQEGLGPSFNVSFCVGCHEQPTFGGSSPRYRDFFLVADRRNGFKPIDQPPSREYEDGPGTFEAPKPKRAKNGVQLRYRTEPPYRNRTPSSADIVAQRNAIPFFGIGALAQIPDEEILKREDVDDRDDDGISGRPNVSGSGAIGRFGRKAQTESLEGFVRGPLFNHLGITTRPLAPAQRRRLPLRSTSRSSSTLRAGLERRVHHQVATGRNPLEDSDDAADPELSREKLFALVSWVRLLAAPEPDELDGRAREGRELFESIGCAACHVPRLEGPRGAVPAYTDLLLHDMGEELADGFAQGDAEGSEFRTQPLWGVAATEPYLHDGRASTLDEAIRLHGGEALRARKNYEDLDDADRRAVVAFLRSLGGADRDSSGLIPPDDPLPEPGEFEGPVEGLTADERERFERGRRLFDGDVDFADGLGPNLNGDSCRACHFEPTPGGAGPAGVNVTREGHLSSDGSFEAPPGGTLLHRFDAAFDRRPAAHERSNVFELRQPPPLYGLGRIDDIPAAAIEERADPDDADGDGISGRVSRPTQGTVGRFGWKAAFPALEDFVRDALSNEMGLTVPARSDAVAGALEDGDDVEDPEFAGDRYRALLFYVDKLAPPPPPDAVDGDVERGESVFAEIGCASCHVPSMRTRDGESVELYSDLLLHEVAPSSYRGVAEADAGPREFRTPPLWGVSKTAPYMHDGLSGSLEHAIRRHAGEASAAARAYGELSGEDREALIAFLHSI